MLTDLERDEILLSLRADVSGLKAGQERLEVYVHYIAKNLLAPEEVANIETDIRSLQQEKQAV